jgi:nucleoside diphosphate kinase
MSPNANERTYIMVKVQPPCPPLRTDLLTTMTVAVPLQPDGVQRGLVGNIIARFEKRGLKLIALKLVHATPGHIEKREFRHLHLVQALKFTHLGFVPPLSFADYEVWRDTPYFPDLLKYMTSGPVVAMVWQGLAAVKTGRAMLGETDPLASSPGLLLSLKS